MSILNNVKTLVGKVTDAAIEASQDAKKLAESVVDKASNELTDIKGQVTEIVTKTVDNAKSAYNEQGGIQGILDKASAEVSEMAQKAKDATVEKAHELKDVAGETFDRAAADIKDVAKTTMDAASEAAGDIKAATVDAVEKVTGADKAPKA